MEGIKDKVSDIVNDLLSNISHKVGLKIFEKSFAEINKDYSEGYDIKQGSILFKKYFIKNRFYNECR